MEGHADAFDAKFRSIAVIAVCEVAAMSLWFSASAVLPALGAELAGRSRVGPCGRCRPRSGSR